MKKSEITKLVRRLNVRFPYAELINKSKAKGLYETTTEKEFIEFTNRLNRRTQLKIFKTQYLERKARLESVA